MRTYTAELGDMSSEMLRDDGGLNIVRECMRWADFPVAIYG